MATEKNITMKEFNGTDYDTLYPKTIASQIPDVYSKTEILTTETLAKYGLTADKLPNDVFQQIKTLIDNTQSSIESRAKIQTGSYVGTGTYGASNPCSLTFDFSPKFLIMLNISTLQVSSGSVSFSTVFGNQADQSRCFINCDLLTNDFSNSDMGFTSSNSASFVKKSIDGKTISWYSTKDKYDQFNAYDAGFVYTYYYATIS